MKGIVALFLSLWLMSTSQASAYLVNGNEILSHCASESFYEQGHCAGYVASIIDANEILVEKANSYFCVPKGVTLGQLLDVLGKYLKDNPDQRHHPATYLVVTAFREAFPCVR